MGFSLETVYSRRFCREDRNWVELSRSVPGGTNDEVYSSQSSDVYHNVFVTSQMFDGQSCGEVVLVRSPVCG